MRRMIAFIALFALATFVAGDVMGLEIQVGPQTIVESSGGDNVTVHTDFPGEPEGLSVILEIGPKGGTAKGVDIVDAWVDDCGFYVVRCDRQAAVSAVGDFEGKFTDAIVDLYIGSACGSQEIRVRHRSRPGLRRQGGSCALDERR